MDAYPNHNQLSDQEYIKGVQASNEQVFAKLVDTYIDTLTRFAFGITGEEDAAHDVIQETFARIWQIRLEWNPQSTVITYLFTAVRNRSLNWLKANRSQGNLVRRLQIIADIEASSSSPSPDDSSANQYISPGMVALIRREIASLTERQREAIHLRYEQQLPVAEVARILGISLRPTEKLIARALENLRDIATSKINTLE